MPSTAGEKEASASLAPDGVTLGVGASGSFDLAEDSGGGAVDLLAIRVGESATARGVSTGNAEQQKMTSAHRTKIHLSSRSPGEVPGTLQLLFTLLYQRTGVTGLLVTFFHSTCPHRVLER